MCITETWLNDSVDSSLLRVSNYSVCRMDRCFRRGGGVAVYLRSNVTYTDISHKFNTLDNIDFIVLDIHSCKIILIFLYIPPSVSSELLQNIHSLLVEILDAALLTKPFYHPIIVGDMNKFNVQSLCSDLGLFD